LLRSLGFREIGTYRNHGQLDGVWRDVVVVERLLNAELPAALHSAVSHLKGKVVPRGTGKRLNALPDIVIPILTGADTGGTLAIFEQITEPGNGPTLHRHRSEDETFYITEGEYQFTIGEQVFQVGPGTHLFGPRGIPHTFKCVGKIPGRIQIALSPAGFE